MRGTLPTLGVASALMLAVPAAAHNIVDVGVTISGPAFAAAGGTITYTVTTADLAYDSAFGMILTDQLPAGVTYKSAGGVGWNCSQSKGTVTCGAEFLHPGANPVTITVTAPPSPSTVTNRARIESIAIIDPYPDNDAAELQTVVYDASRCIAAAPMLLAPADGAVLPGGAAHLAWTAVSGATGFGGLKPAAPHGARVERRPSGRRQTSGAMRLLSPRR